MGKRKFFAILLFLITPFFNSCTKDNAADNRDSLIGYYNVTETWTENSKKLTKPTFSIIVEKASQKANMILLNNFADYGAGVTAEAIVTGKDITLSQQTLPNQKVIIGIGTVSDSSLVFTYTESINSISVVVSAIAKKR